MKQPKNSTAINVLKLLALLACLCTGMQAYAAGIAGTITQLSGPLLDKKADGTLKALSQKSTIEQGDTLITEKNTYAQIKFIDNGEITLRPNTQLKIDSFAFEEDKPESDSAVFNLIKGGLRSVTGLLGKRNKERFGLTTPTATIGIRGTIFIAEYVTGEEQPAEQQAQAAYRNASVAAISDNQKFPDYLEMNTRTDVEGASGIVPLQLAQNVPPASTAGRSPGLYVQVLDGMIHLTNGGGTQNFTAGQFGYTASFVQPPVILPANPGMQFTPPPSFSSTTTTQGSSGSSKSGTVDCEVR